MKNTYYDQLWLKEWGYCASIGPSTRSRERIIIRLMKKFAMKGDLLDVGCGIGTLLSQIPVKTGITEISGCDFSQEAIEIAERAGFNVFVADLTDINTFPPKKYDIIICSEVLEHIEDDDSALLHLHSLVQNGGRIVISVPYAKQNWSAHDEFAGHIRRYEYDELTQKIERANFSILESFVWGFPVYALYHSVLVRCKPDDMMGYNSTQKTLKRYLSYILYYLFHFDDFFINFKKGRRVFIVAEKT